MFLVKLFGFLLLNSALYFSIFRFFYFWKDKISSVDRLILSFLIYLTVILGIPAISGYFHIYESKTVTILIIALALFFCIFKGKAKESFLSSYYELRNLFKRFFLYLKKDPLLLILFILIFLEFLIITRFTFLYPPQGWDSYTYHLPLASRMVIEKGFPPREFLDLNPNMYFSNNVEVLFAYYYMFMGTDKGILIIHIPFLIFGALSTYSILRKLNIPNEKSLYIFSCLSIPIIPNLAGFAFVDIEVACVFLIFLNLLFLKFPYNIVFLIISLSIGAGTKWSFLTMFGIFILFSVIKLSMRRKYGLILLSLFLCLVTSFHYYIYNFFLTGNPLYPYIVKIFGIEIFKGIDIPSSIGNMPIFTYNPFIIIPRLLEFGYDYIKYYVSDNHGGGFGHLFISFGIIPFIIAVFLSIKNKEKTFLKIVFFSLLIFLTVPYRWWARFHVYLPFIAFIGTIYIWERLKQKNLKGLIIMLTFLSLIQGIHDRIILSPYSGLNSYKDNTFEIFYIPEEIKESYSKLSFYLKENDRIGVWTKDWSLSENPRNLMGLVLRNNFLISLNAIQKEENLKNYSKIITSPNTLIENYTQVYKDKNLCLWVK